MATDIVLRSVKASELTHAEMDQNWESLAVTVDSVIANYTVLVTDQNKILECSIASGTITLLTLADAAGTDTDSFNIIIKNINATSLTVAGNGSETIEGANTISLLENETVEMSLVSDALEWNIIGFYNPNLIGVTASKTELNFSDGVTSAIQSQLDNRQPLDADLTAIAALPNTDSNFIVGNGSAWVAESGATARTSLGVDPSGTDNSTDVTLAGTPNYLTITGQIISRGLISLISHITGILPLGNGGTNSGTAAGARTNLDVDQAGTDNSTPVSLAGSQVFLSLSGQVLTMSDIIEADLAAAVVAKLVTNGNSHNHSGGDGGSIPNASITGLGALALLGAVGEAEVNWASAGGMTQQVVHQKEFNDPSLGTGYQAIDTDSTFFHIYVPSNANSVEFYIEAKRSTTNTLKFQATIAATTSAAMDINSSSYAFVSGTVDVSALSGWQSCFIEWQMNTGTQNCSVRRISVRVI